MAYGPNFRVLLALRLLLIYCPQPNLEAYRVIIEGPKQSNNRPFFTSILKDCTATKRDEVLVVIYTIDYHNHHFW